MAQRCFHASQRGTKPARPALFLIPSDRAADGSIIPHPLCNKGGRIAMYEARFGLRRRPYPATPDGSCYYPATSHERALAQLQRALDDGEGIVVLTGTPGTGKTLLCHCLLERLGSQMVSALVTNSHLPSRAALFQAILYD